MFKKLKFGNCLFNNLFLKYFVASHKLINKATRRDANNFKIKKPP